MKTRLPIAAAFWLPPLIVPITIGALLSPHAFSDPKIVLLAMITSLLYSYAAAAVLGIPAFGYFRSKRAPKLWWASVFGAIAGMISMLIALVVILSTPMDDPNWREPRAAYLFSFVALGLLFLGAVLGTAVAALSWRLLKAYPPLQRFL